MQYWLLIKCSDSNGKQGIDLYFIETILCNFIISPPLIVRSIASEYAGDEKRKSMVKVMIFENFL